MNKELLQIMAVISKVTTLVDGGTKVTIDTGELAPQQMTQLFGLKGKSGWLVFKENQISQEDIPEIDADIIDKTKSPTKRLYNVLYVLWEQRADKSKYPEFEVYRVAKMEEIINSVKERLE